MDSYGETQVQMKEFHDRLTEPWTPHIRNLEQAGRRKSGQERHSEAECLLLQKPRRLSLRPPVDWTRPTPCWSAIFA